MNKQRTLEDLTTEEFEQSLEDFIQRDDEEMPVSTFFEAFESIDHEKQTRRKRLLKTNVSEAFWPIFAPEGKVVFERAKIAMGENKPEYVSWFDKLFEGGLVIPQVSEKPLTLLITGSPGSGKTTLALELCYRLANRTGGEFPLYISTDSDATQLISNAESFWGTEVRAFIYEYSKDNPVRFRDGMGATLIWGTENIADLSGLSRLLNTAVRAGERFFFRGIPELADMVGPKRRPEIDRLRSIPAGIVVVDSLNRIPEEESGGTFQMFLKSEITRRGKAGHIYLRFRVFTR